MIDSSKIDKQHKQYDDTCLLSNYAICCNYLTNIPTLCFFEDYFKEFDSDFSDPSQIINNERISRSNNEYKSLLQGFIIDYNIYKTNKCDINYLMNKYAIIFVLHLHLKTYKGFIPYGNYSNDLTGFDFLELIHNNIKKQNFVNCKNAIDFIRINYDKEKKILTNNCFELNSIEDLNHFLQNHEALINVYDDMRRHSYTIYYDSTLNEFCEHDTNFPNRINELNANWFCNYTFNKIILYNKK